MKQVLIIGIGRFGRHLCRKFIELGDDVMIVDKNEENLKEFLPFAASAQICDCTKADALKSLGVNNFDLCFVCIESSFQSSLEITSLLKEMGARRVISKSSRDIHTKFLLRNGADEVIDPERESAEKLAVRHSNNNLFDYLELTKDVSIYEITPADSWLGKSIKELNFRNKYHASILAIKVDDNVSPMPPSDYRFKEDEHLIIMGRNSDVEKILKILK
jgi:trk system potassium uptake protein TrkA